MALTDDISFVGKLIDDYAARCDPVCRWSVGARAGETRGVPREMQVGEIDAHGWVEWRVLPSTLTEAEVAEVEEEFGVVFPPLFRAYLLARFHLFDQVHSRRYGQLIFITETPFGRPLQPLREESLAPWSPLIDSGFIPFAEWGDGWGPMCFDSHARSNNGDCPVVWMDHEELIPLGEEKSRIRKNVLPYTKPLYSSCREFFLDIFTVD